MFKALRRYYWLTQKFIARHYSVILKTTSGVLVLGGIAIFVSRYIPASRDVIRIGIVGKYTPETMPTIIQKQVSAGLVTMSSTGEANPALAASWDISNDGKTYTFTLNNSIVWHDGSRLVPSDIVYNFKEVETVYNEDGTVTFRLQEPFAPFLQAVSKPLIKNGKVGTGTLQIQRTKVIGGVLQEVVLVSETSKEIYKFYPTESSALTAFKLGEIDRVDNISYVPQELLGDSALSIRPNTDNSRIAVLFFNNHDSVLGSKPTRQGLTYAIKDKSLGHTRALSPIDQKSWAYNPLVKEYGYDAERAKNLFFTDIGKDSIPSLELKTTLAYLDVAEKIAADWREVLGVSVDVKVVTNIGTDYQILLTDFAPPADPDQYTVWHSTQSTNFTHYSNLKVDKLLEDGRRTLDKKLRIDIYQDFQRFLLEDCPAVFLYYTTGNNIARKPVSW